LLKFRAFPGKRFEPIQKFIKTICARQPAGAGIIPIADKNRYYPNAGQPSWLS
jgi:hypothetical protein